MHAPKPSFPRIMAEGSFELPIVEWLTEGSVPRELDDRLPIVKADTRLDLWWVKAFLPPEYFYHAVTQHRHGNGSKWKDGYVGDKQHVSIRTSLFPDRFASAHDFAAFIGRLVDDGDASSLARNIRQDAMSKWRMPASAWPGTPARYASSSAPAMVGK